MALTTVGTNDIAKLSLRKAAKQVKYPLREVLPKHPGKVHGKVAAYQGTGAEALSAGTPPILNG